MHPDGTRTVNREALTVGLAAEQRRFLADHPRCGEMAAAGRAHMPLGVPMSWMAKWPGAYPVHVIEASGAYFSCADGLEHTDLCLGDTGAMSGHSPAATVAAVQRQAARQRATRRAAL